MTSRRLFIQTTITGVAALALRPLLFAAATSGIAVSARMHEDFASGVAMGLDELEVTAGLLRRTFSRSVESQAPMDTVVLHSSEAAAVIGATPGPCGLRVLPDTTERELALERWKAANPRNASDLEIVAWDSTLFRYGATQLNQRFTERFGRGMSELAWGGWISAKLAGEALMRFDDPVLAVRGMSVDGHKGIPLSFAADGALIQPLYVIEQLESERRVHEVAPEGSE